MSTTIEFSSEKRWTIVMSHIDQEEMKAWVQNVGMTESQLKKEFKMSKTNGFEKEISCHELKTMLNYVTKNYIIEGVFEIENHFNTDQKTINEIKRNIENRLRSKGYEIVEHCFSSGEIDVDPGNVYESRGYLKLLNDRCQERKTELANIRAEKAKTESELVSLEHDKEVMQKEFDELCSRYREGTKFLKDVDDDVAKYKDKIYLLDEEKNKLFIEVEEKKKELKDLEKGIDKMHIESEKRSGRSERISSELRRKETELNDLNIKIETATMTLNEINTKIEKYINLMRQL